MPHPTPIEADVAPRLAIEFVYLFIAIGTGVIALAIWILDMTTQADVPQGIYAALCVVTTVAGCGYLVHAAEARLNRTFVHLIAEARREAYAAGFVDGVTERDAANGHHSASVTSIH